MEHLQTMIRQAAVEGQFYPSTKKSVFKLIRDLEEHKRYSDLPAEKKQVFGAVLPHAGHIYSGSQTIPFFRYLKKYSVFPETFIILHPNHRGIGPDVALDKAKTWRNSIGDVEIDIELKELLPYAADSSAHQAEHSAEVIIPFIQYYFKESSFRILPVCIKNSDAGKMKSLAKSIEDAVTTCNRKVMLIASSDFSHYVSPSEGKKADDMVLQKIMQRETDEVEHVVLKNKISVCGYGPIMTLMAYSGLLDRNYGVTELARGHSGDVYPSREVVDYISLIFHSKN